MKKSCNAYTVEYYQNGEYEDVQEYVVLARSKEEAYERFMWIKDWSVYGAWVASVAYQNGNVRVFNNFCGKPY